MLTPDCDGCPSLVQPNKRCAPKCRVFDGLPLLVDGVCRAKGRVTRPCAHVTHNCPRVLGPEDEGPLCYECAGTLAAKQGGRAVIAEIAGRLSVEELTAVMQTADPTQKTCNSAGNLAPSP